MNKLKRKISKYKNLIIGIFINYDSEDNVNSNYNTITNDISSSTFFGYYDKTPFNKLNSNIILFHETDSNPKTKANALEACRIVVYDVHKNHRIANVDSTLAWNWQQGARLHWFTEASLIYNYYNEERDKVVSKVFNLNSKKSVEHPIPVQESIQGKYIIDINYGLLNDTAPEYGYKCINKPEEANQIRVYDCSERTVIWEIDEVKVIENLSDETLYNNKSTHFNHLMASPDGKKFIGLFRYYKKRNKYHVLLNFNLNEKSIKILLQDEVVSHYTWMNDDEIIFWGKVKSKPGYYKMNVISKKITLLCESKLDGHPNMMGIDMILTDTYPLEGRRKSLYKFNLNNCEKEIMGTFFEPTYCHGENRCDLHPRLSQDKLFISIDTMHDNKRMMKIIDLHNEQK